VVDQATRRAAYLEGAFTAIRNTASAFRANYDIVGDKSRSTDPGGGRRSSPWTDLEGETREFAAAQTARASVPDRGSVSRGTDRHVTSSFHGQQARVRQLAS
jgi:hypothetical protein